MGDENHIRTLGDYSKLSHEGYKNTIELPAWNNVVHLRSDTIRSVQNRCSFHGLRSKDPNQHFKDFLKLVDSLYLDGENRERTRMHLFQFSLRDQASNWLERLPAGSIFTWEDLTTRFLAQFFPPRRTAKLRNDILMFQQHHGESLSEAWTQSWAIFEDLTLYDNESWNHPRDFAKPVKAITLPQDVPNTSDRHLIKLKTQVQRLMEAHLAPTQPTQVKKITTPCEICSGPHDTQNCMENLEQAFVEYASSHTDEAGGKCSINAITIHPKQPDESQVNEPEVEQEKDNPGDTNSNPHPQPDPLASIATEQLQKLNSMLESLGLVPQSPNMKFVCSKEDDGEVMFIEIIRYDNEPQNKDPNEGEGATAEETVVEYFDTFLTRNELTYHRTDEVAYKMPHKIEQYDSLSDLEKEHTKSVYLRNGEDKRRGVEYVMSKILGYYKECLELGPEYLIGIDDEGEVT
ncbi:MAK10-like protein [Tanacetum coccineum]